MHQAEEGLEELRKHVDTLIVIPNQRLLSIVDRGTPLTEAFKLADEVLYNATRGIAEIINVGGLVNVDFADVRTIMRDMGDALMGSGIAEGENRAVEAAQAAISSPLLEGVSIAGAQGILINFTGGRDLSLLEIDEAASIIQEAAGEDANVIWGVVIDEKMEDQMMVTVIATGFNRRHTNARGMGSSGKQAVAGNIRHIPSGIMELRDLDTPAYIRKGMHSAEQEEEPPREMTEEEIKQRIDKGDPDKPAFLRKIMD